MCWLNGELPEGFKKQESISDCEMALLVEFLNMKICIDRCDLKIYTAKTNGDDLVLMNTPSQNSLYCYESFQKF